MSTNLILRANVTANDVAFADMETSDDFYVDIEEGDSLIFSAGGDGVADGEDIPTETELNRAATIINPIAAVEVAKYFLADATEDLLLEVFNAGRVAKQYVFCASFDGATASIPVLEAWDDENADSYDSVCLGGGTPSQSWYWAICTTTSAPLLNWTGIPLAGSGASNSLELDTAALTTAKDLYFNFTVMIPAGVTQAMSATPTLLITYTTN
jgi:hypothetical protein